MHATPVNRRHVLRGLGTALALPAFESLLPRPARAAARPAVRMAFVYIPNGVHMPAWTPTREGVGFDLPPTLAPLAAHREQLLVLSGLTHDKARANGDGPGDHARSAAAFLTGCQPLKTAGTDIRAGVSLDQLAAQRIGDQTAFRSLELGLDRSAQAGNCDSGYSCAYSSNISWSAPGTPVAKETNPRLVFDRLFVRGTSAEAASALSQRDRTRRSILDAVLEEARGLQDQLGGHDRDKLDEYLSSVREIERRLAFHELGGAVDLPGATRPSGPPGTFGEHARLMADMLALAFRADLTRVATLMFANEGSNRSYPEIGVGDGHHNISHHQGDTARQELIQQINRHHAEQFAYLIDTLAAAREADGSSLLEHCLVCYASAIGDGNRHNHDDLPVVVVGRGGGTWKTGRHLRFPANTPMCNLYLAMLETLGVHEPRFGDSTGYLTGLTA
ncbi:MAG: DUF1552 domain-containing protein [Fimbriimonadaceae bacterium]|nr:DUF1552 domain-containing protein [Fimbriimonadaceae bacterium]